MEGERGKWDWVTNSRQMGSPQRINGCRDELSAIPDDYLGETLTNPLPRTLPQDQRSASKKVSFYLIQKRAQRGLQER